VPRIHFTSHLEKHLDCPTRDVVAANVREALDAVFAENPRLQGYVLDDQQRLRQHVVIFVDDRTISDREALSDAVGDTSEIFVMQALSGG
jgi:hypothetical protein